MVEQTSYGFILDPQLEVEHLKVHDLSSYLKMRFKRGCGQILADLRENSLHPIRFVPMINILRVQKEWRAYQAHFSTTALDGIKFFGLAVLTRWTQVLGRIYYYFKEAPAYKETMKARAETATGKAWQSAASPTKLRYLNEYAIGRTALDIGTGYGFYAKYLLEKGFAVDAVDMDPRPELPYPCKQGVASEIPFEGRYDTVVMFDVLEHEPNEADALEELQRVVGNRLILSVPNANDTTLHPYNLTFKHHIDKTHHREYTVDELQQKLEAHGFQIITISTEGAVSPAVFAEFVRFAPLRVATKFVIKALAKLGVLKSDVLHADVYVVAEKIE